jgi:hypothetical protein
LQTPGWLVGRGAFFRLRLDAGFSLMRLAYFPITW